MTEPEDFLPSTEIAKELNNDEEAPWSEWRGGLGISIEKLAVYLRRFKVKSVQRQISNTRARGYALGDLKPVFEHYL